MKIGLEALYCKVPEDELGVTQEQAQKRNL